MILEDIAYLPPHIGGESVYSARIMLDIDVDETEGLSYRTSNENEIIEEKSIFTLYPTPASDKLVIELGEVDEEIRIVIHDITGVEVYNSTALNTQHEINVEDWKSGIYSYSISGLKNQEKGKIVIVH